MRSNKPSTSQANVTRTAVAVGRMAAVLLIAVAVSAAAASPEPAKPVTTTATAQEPPLPGLEAVLDELRKGGLVIFFRHSVSDQTGQAGEADLANCATQRNLTAEGRELATQIGTAFRALRITVGTVATTPLCRGKETAQLAFGRFTVNNDLNSVLGADAEKTKQLAGSLRQILSTPPAAGTNAVIVSHNTNLREAAGLWPKPEGVSYVFRPLSGGRFEALARIAPEAWANMVNKK